ncbi:GNAT family N-acetyltransferase [Verrucomicrobiota bacterium]
MKIKTYQSITELENKQWNSITSQNNIICKHEYLRSIEESNINNCKYFYPVVYEGNKIIAHTCVYFISTELDTFAKGFLKKSTTAVRNIWKNFLILRSVECGTPVALGSTISFLENSDKHAALAQIVHEIERLAKDLKVGVVLFRDFYNNELNLYDQLQNTGYKRINNLPSAKLGIHWNSFDEYLNAMRRNYRRKILVQQKRFLKNGGCIEILQDFSHCTLDLERLWKNAYDHASEYRREVLTQNFFKNTDHYLGDRSAVILAKVNNSLVGFALLLFDHDTVIPLFCGLDYSYNREHCVYFNLLYKVIETGIDRGMKDIDFGITTMEPKLDLGAVVVPLYMYMKHLNPILNYFVPKAFDIMTPKKSLHSRNVFKHHE